MNLSSEDLSKKILEIYRNHDQPETLAEACLIIAIWDLLKKSEDKKRMDIPDFYFEEATKEARLVIPEIETSWLKKLFYSCYISNILEKYAEAETPKAVPYATRTPDWITNSGAYSRGYRDFYHDGEASVGYGQREILHIPKKE